ncbi:MAG: murein biosynthesis integral membrane protein MurJ [Alphaproteobacteria bacterium]
MKLYKSIATVSGFTAISRVLGFVRDMLIAAVIGAGPVADAFFVAFRLPNLFRSLFAEGAFNSAFVPLFSKSLTTDGKSGARRFAEEALAVLLTVLIILTLAAEIGMPWIISLLAGGFEDNAEKFDLAVLLTRITFPYLLCMSLTALTAGILNALGRFVAAAAAPILLNIILSAAMIIAASFGLYHKPEAAMILAWAVSIAGFAQLAFLTVGARRQGMDLGFRLPRLTPGVKRLFWLAVPGVMTAGITQINLFVGTMIASHSNSAVSYLYYADRVNQLPLGIVGIAIGVVLLPELSRRLASNDESAAMHSHNRALEFALFLTVPAAVALCVIPLPVIQALFQRGAFTAENAHAVATTLTAFAVGLPASVLIRVLLPGFFARENTRIPMIFATISGVLNIAASVTLFFFTPLGYVGIAIATSLAAWTNASLLGGTLLYQGHFRLDSALQKRGPLIILTSFIMGGVVWGLSLLIGQVFGPISGSVWHILTLVALVTSGGAVYLVGAQLIGAVDFRTIWRSLNA